jgi:hypothetical protein
VNVLSIDLALKRYAEIGICVLSAHPDRIEVVPARPAELGLTGAPRIGALAKAIVQLAEHWSTRLILIDGSQAWKAADSELAHARVCERALATQGKTGLPRTTKPASFAGFATFAVELFEELSVMGWPRLPGEAALRTPHPFALEAYPTSAWRALGLRPLPSRARTGGAEIPNKLAQLARVFPLSAPALTHDELQATVAGLAGLGIEGHPAYGFTLAGVAPFEHDGEWREGFIVNPVRR